MKKKLTWTQANHIIKNTKTGKLLRLLSNIIEVLEDNSKRPSINKDQQKKCLQFQSRVYTPSSMVASLGWFNHCWERQKKIMQIFRIHWIKIFKICKNKMEIMLRCCLRLGVINYLVSCLLWWNHMHGLGPRCLVFLFLAKVLFNTWVLTAKTFSSEWHINRSS